MRVLLESLTESQVPSEFVFLYPVEIDQHLNPSFPTFVFVKAVVVAVYCSLVDQNLDSSRINS